METTPLADRLRPTQLSDFVGQEHLVGKEGMVKKLLDHAQSSGFFPSLIFWGPPGCGKTTLARIIANKLQREFFEFSAVNTSIKEVEKVIKDKTRIHSTHQPSLINSNTGSTTQTKSPIIFIDEIHRFNKAQQDALLPHVERGRVILIGATTENPSFEVIGPLLSRCRVLILNQLDEIELNAIIKRGLRSLRVNLESNAQDFLVNCSNGDARVALNVLEIAANIAQSKLLTLTQIESALQKRQLYFDLKGEEYYNTISALHKAIRGSDPDAALYYLARMLEAGQDPLYIARRLIRAASEDIGLADPLGLVIANAAFEAADKIGLPECNTALAQATVYLAKAPKSNALYLAYNEAAEDVHQHGNLPIPLHIRNPVTKLMSEIGYGKGYQYHHSSTGKKLAGINYLPEKLKDKRYITKRFKTP